MRRWFGESEDLGEPSRERIQRAKLACTSMLLIVDGILPSGTSLDAYSEQYHHCKGAERNNPHLVCLLPNNVEFLLDVVRL